jgi:hypothetical protein
MAKGMDEAEVSRLKTLVEKSGTPWEVVGPLVRSKGTYRITIRHKGTGAVKLMSNFRQWQHLMSVETNRTQKAAGTL